MSKKGKIIFVLATLFIIIAIAVGVIFGLRNISTTPNIQNSSFPLASSSQGVVDGNSIENTTTSSQVHGLTDDTESLPADLKRLTLLTKNPVMAYWIATSSVVGEVIASSSPLQSVVFYMNAEGDIIRIHADGRESIVSHLGESPLHIIQSVSGSRVVVEFTSGSFALFDVSRGAFEFLPQGTVSAVFSPDGNTLAYLMAQSSGKQELFIRDMTSLQKTTTKLFSLSLNDIKLAWPVDTRIYLLPLQSGSVVGEIWYFDIRTKTMNLFISKVGIGALFSTISPSALIFYNENTSSIRAYIQNITKESSIPLAASTLLSKCTFSLDAVEILCATPQIQSKTSGVQLPDDYNAMSIFTNDSLQRFSAAHNYKAQDILTTTQAPFDAKDVRSRGRQMFFIDRLTDGLYMFDMRGL